MHWRSVFSLILLTICPVTLWPQGTRSARPVEIHGRVLLSNGQPAPVGTIVTLETPGGGFNGQAQTNGQGKFEFPQMTPAVYEVHVRAFGYLPESQTMDMTNMPSAYINFTLKPIPVARMSRFLPAGRENPSVLRSTPRCLMMPRKTSRAGRTLLSRGKDVNKSIEFFKKAIARYPQYSEAYLLMGVAYSSQKKWDDAEKALQKTIELNKTREAPTWLLALSKMRGRNTPWPRSIF